MRADELRRRRADSDAARPRSWCTRWRLAEWHRAHRYCPRCGGRLVVLGGRHVLAVQRCGRQQFPRTDPAVIMLVTDDDDRGLLGRQAAWPEGRYSTLAGFVDPGESLEEAVVREVLEEAGVEVDRRRPTSATSRGRSRRA